MKQSILAFLFAFSAIALYAQNQTTNDEKQIQAGVDALIKSWNNHDYTDLKNYATDDCEWVNVVGMWWKNREEVEYAHAVFHQKMFKNTPLTQNSAAIKLLTPEVAIVHLNYHVGAYSTPSGHNYPEADNLTTLIFVKKQGKWLLRAGQNVVIDEKAAASNPVLKMPKQ